MPRTAICSMALYGTLISDLVLAITKYSSKKPTSCLPLKKGGNNGGNQEDAGWWMLMDCSVRKRWVKYQESLEVLRSKLKQWATTAQRNHNHKVTWNSEINPWVKNGRNITSGSRTLRISLYMDTSLRTLDQAPPHSNFPFEYLFLEQGQM